MKKDLVKIHHARSEKDFPELNLKDDEYVALALKRTWLGLLAIWVLAALAAVFLTIVAIAMSANIADQNSTLSAASLPYLYMVVMILYAADLLMALVSTSVYRANKLYVTNKRLIHYRANSLVSKSVNIIDLVSVEDVSFSQDTLIDHIFRIGSLRLSTVGDETTYILKYAPTLGDEMETITYLVHVAKTRRKVTQNEN